MCHNKAEKGAQYTKWMEGPHSGAFETLKSEESAKIAADQGISGNAWVQIFGIPQLMIKKVPKL